MITDTSMTLLEDAERKKTLASSAHFNIVEVISEGEIEGFTGSFPNTFDGVYFDNTKWVDNGVYNFQGIEASWKYGTDSQDYLSGFPQVQTTTNVNTEVTKYSPAYAGSGDGSVSRTITNTDADAVIVTMRIPALYYNVPDFEGLGEDPIHVETPGPKWYAQPGDVTSAALWWRIDITASDAATSWLQLPKYGKSTSTYDFSVRMELPGTGPWTVKVSRVSEKAENEEWFEAYYKNGLYWASYTEVQDHKLIYPYTAVVGMSIPATAFGGALPARSYEVKGIKCEVPDNYDPETRVYTGSWGGTFSGTKQYTNNPAWVLYDLLRSSRYGLGLSASQVDKWSLYSIAEYCDALVDDGEGGQEPRYTCNGVIQARKDSATLVQSIASIFRGQCYLQGGVIYTVADMPADPVKLVNNANVNGGVFNYTGGTSLRDKHTVAIVTYNDPDDGYRLSPVLIEDAEAISSYGWKELNISAFMCTSQGQAYRLGKSSLDDETYLYIVSYQAALDHSDLMPGDIISLADSGYMGARYGGRIREALTTSKINIDDSLTLAGGETYELSVVLPDGSIESETISSVDSLSILNLSSAFTDSPISGAMFTITSTLAEPRQFRIMSVKEAGGLNYDITGVFHDPTKYARIESNLQVDTPSYTTYPTGALSAPSALKVVEYLSLNGATPVAQATISWTPSSDPRVIGYRVYAQGNEGVWKSYGLASTPSTDITVTDGTWSFRVVGIDGLGNNTQALELTQYLQALLAPPLAVKNFKVSARNDIATLTWDRSKDLDLSHYMVKYTPLTTGALWATASILKNGIVENTTNVSALPGTYLIKAVDTSDVESDDAVSVVLTADYLSDINAVVTIQEQTSFDGVKDDTVVSSSKLILDTDSGEYYPEGYYYFDGGYTDLGDLYIGRVISTLKATVIDSGYTMSEWGTLEDVNNIFDSGLSGWSAKIEARISPDISHDWVEINDSSSFGISAECQHDGNSYLITSTADVYKSTDNGATWVEVTTSGTMFVARRNGTAFSYDSKLWFGGGISGYPIGTVRLDFWYSSDDGATWTQSGSMPSNANYSPVYVSFDGYMYLANKDYLYRTSDGSTFSAVSITGDDWRGVSTYIGGCVYDGVFYIATRTAGDGGILHKSTDGVAWTEVDTGLPWDYATDFRLVDYDNGLMMLVNETAYVSEDEGATWTELGHCTTTPATVSACFNAGNNYIYLVSNSGITDDNFTGYKNQMDDITFGDWFDLEIADYEAQLYEFRLYMSTENTTLLTPAIEELEVEIDLPDRQESADNITVPAGGLDVDFNKAFGAVPAIAVTCQDMATGDYLVKSDTLQTRHGFHVQILNSAGSGVERTIDWIARGYGRV